MTTVKHRQESHRIYLQQTKRSKDDSSNSNERYTIATSSAAIRLTSFATCRDVTQLLRRKFGLPALASVPSKDGGRDVNPSPPLMNRIRRHLDKVRGGTSLGDKTTEFDLKEIKQYDSTKDDALVLVVTCFYMPRGYINFEHEAEQSSFNKRKIQHDDRSNIVTSALDRQNHLAYDDSNTDKLTTTGQDSRWSTTPASTPVLDQNHSMNPEKSIMNPSNHQKDVEPINIIQTIVPHQNPLEVKDDLMKYVMKMQINSELEMKASDSIAGGNILRKKPILRWFFMPCHIAVSTSCQEADSSSENTVRYIEVEGYCSDALTDSDGCSSDDSDDDEENEFQKCDDTSIPRWKQMVTPYANYDKYAGAEKNNVSKSRRTRLQKERHRLAVLNRFKSSLGNSCVSGYLLKQSKRDEHVWKQVRVVLNDDQFWYIGRTKNIDQRISHPQHGARKGTSTARIGKHTIVHLKGAILHISMNKEMTLSSTPYVFELMTKSGASHIFRALNSNVYLRWTRCLSERIERCHENASFDLADLIASGETFAKGKRCEDSLLKPTFVPLVESKSSCLHMFQDNFRNENVHNMLCFAIGIAEYKELCRRIQHATIAGVRVAIVNTRAKAEDNDEQCLSNENAILSEDALENEQYLQSMIFAAWNIAESLFTKSFLPLPASTNSQNKILSCQNDIRQRIDKNQTPATNNKSTLVSPSVDLFDALFDAVKENYSLQ